MIRVVYGQAGSGKTQLLVAEAISLLRNGKSVVILCPTHSSKLNVIERYKTISGLKRLPKLLQIRTYFSFYRIDYRNNTLLGFDKAPDAILFDEFSLINRSLFKMMMNRTPQNLQITLYGDPAQLNPVGTSTEKTRITMKKLKACMDRGLDFSTIYHYVGSIASTHYIRLSEKKLLTVNRRANDRIAAIIDELFFRDDPVIPTFDGLLSVTNKLQTGEWTYIATTYQSIEAVYSNVKRHCTDEYRVQCFATVPHLNELYFKKGAEFIVGETTKYFVNGELVTCEEINDESITLKGDHDSCIYRGEFSLLPIHFLSAHKSQGMTIKNVIVNVDNLFEPAILYTMITRASENISFFRHESTDTDLLAHLKQTRKLLEFYGYRSRKIETVEQPPVEPLNEE